MCYNDNGCIDMRNKKENLWTEIICDLLKEELDNNKYEVVCLEKIPYSVYLNKISKDEKEIKIKSLKKFEVDLLINEKKDNCLIPRLIIESKYESITTHDVITYSNKAKAHKDLYSGLRYGLMIGNSKEKGVSPRVIEHGNNFDFVFVFQNDIPTKKEREIFVKIVKRNLDISNKLDNIVIDKGKKDREIYYCIEKNIEFYD